MMQWMMQWLKQDRPMVVVSKVGSCLNWNLINKLNTQPKIFSPGRARLSLTARFARETQSESLARGAVTRFGLEGRVEGRVAESSYKSFELDSLCC